MAYTDPDYPAKYRAWNREKQREYNKWYYRERKNDPNSAWGRGQEKHLLRTYGITPERYAEMWTAQDGKCEICRSDLVRGRHTHVDHNHETGQIRGLLCNMCNHAIGNLKERVDLFEAGVAYLKRYQGG